MKLKNINPVTNQIGLVNHAIQQTNMMEIYPQTSSIYKVNQDTLRGR